MVKNDLNDISTRYVYNENKQLSKVIKSERFLLESKEFYREELFYDKANNRTKRVVNGVEELYAYDNRNRLTQFTKDNKTTSFKWDNAGNLLQDDKANYTYNDFNQTTKVETFDGNIQINKYDAEGLRYEMEENGQLVQFIFNTNKEVIAEKENEWTIYIRGSEILASSNDHARTYYHYANDEMGSCTHIVDDSKVLNEYEYDAWGNVVNKKETVKNRFKFNGQQLDPITHQYYLRARFYNPVVARFTQEDTYRGDGLNLYAYCANNPVYYVDPSGNACDPAKEILEDILNKNKNLTEEQARNLAELKLKRQNKVGNEKNISNTNIDEKGYKPKPGERTFEGYIKENVPLDVETKLFTASKHFNTNPKEDGHFKRFGSKPNQHGIEGVHVHQPERNINPKNGIITGKPGSKTKNGGVSSPSKKDISQLYDYLNNNKYQRK